MTVRPAVVDPRAECAAAPIPAAQDFDAPTGWPRWVCIWRDGVIIGLIPIIDPFPYITGYIHSTIWAGPRWVIKSMVVMRFLQVCMAFHLTE